MTILVDGEHRQLNEREVKIVTEAIQAGQKTVRLGKLRIWIEQK